MAGSAPQKTKQDLSHIRVQGARENNLKNVNLDIPRDAMVVFTGLSGSGKSSLAFDTIFAEGQRRYVESLSSYARMFLGQVDKPDVDFIEGLSPAVSIDQKSTSKNPRSTVGTITEIYDYMRLLWARVGHPHCPECGEEISKQSPQQIVDILMGYPEKTKLQVLAPVVSARKGEFVDLFKELSNQGYSRARVDGETIQLQDAPKLEKQYKHTIEVVVDRIAIKESVHQRLTDSVETALGLADGKVLIDFVDVDPAAADRTRSFSENLACPQGHALQVTEVEPRAFSFNSPFGACSACDGIGSKLQVDEDLIIPNPDLSLAEGAITPWSQGKSTSEYWLRLLAGLGDELGFELTTPWKNLPAKIKKQSCTVRTTKSPLPTKTVLAVSAATRRASKESTAISNVSTKRPNLTGLKTVMSSTCVTWLAKPVTERVLTPPFWQSRWEAAQSPMSPRCLCVMPSLLCARCSSALAKRKSLS